MKYLIPETGRNKITPSTLTQWEWEIDRNGTACACVMGQFVPKARGVPDCAKAGWPEWLAGSVIGIFDRLDLAEGEKFALDIEQLVSVPRDYDHAFYRYIRNCFMMKHGIVDVLDQLKINHPEPYANLKELHTKLLMFCVSADISLEVAKETFDVIEDELGAGDALYDMGDAENNLFELACYFSGFDYLFGTPEGNTVMESVECYLFLQDEVGRNIPGTRDCLLTALRKS
jgi:hypothetical protein